MKLTYEERNRVRVWLDKDKDGPDQGKTMELNGVTLSRDTLYTGAERNWKVRVAFVVETGYPVAMSAPIPGNLDSKHQMMGKNGKVAMVPKFATPPKDSLDAQIAKYKATMSAELLQPNSFTSWFEDIEPEYECGYCFDEDEGCDACADGAP